MFCLILAKNNNFIYLDEFEIAVAEKSIHEALKCLGRIFLSERHKTPSQL
jgi:hypothetical protein